MSIGYLLLSHKCGDMFYFKKIKCWIIVQIANKYSDFPIRRSRIIQKPIFF